jgi:hypothetical protein
MSVDLAATHKGYYAFLMENCLRDVNILLKEGIESGQGDEITCAL